MGQLAWAAAARAAAGWAAAGWAAAGCKGMAGLPGVRPGLQVAAETRVH